MFISAFTLEVDCAGSGVGVVGAGGDRSSELSEWVEILRKVHKRKIQIFAYANNHYAGHAPATVELFRDLWRSRERADPVKRRQAEKARTLFD